ncbi:unnamed protein product, partial [Prorocentrum cordatum]
SHRSSVALLSAPCAASPWRYSRDPPTSAASATHREKVPASCTGGEEEEEEEEEIRGRTPASHVDASIRCLACVSRWREVHAIQRRQAWPGPKSAQEWRTDHLGCATGTWTPSLYPDGDSSIFVAILAVPGALRSRLRLR